MYKYRQYGRGYSKTINNAVKKKQNKKPNTIKQRYRRDIFYRTEIGRKSNRGGLGENFNRAHVQQLWQTIRCFRRILFFMFFNVCIKKGGGEYDRCKQFVKTGSRKILNTGCYHPIFSLFYQSSKTRRSRKSICRPF